MNKNYYPLLTNGIQVLNTFQCDYCENAISLEPSKLSYFLKTGTILLKGIVTIAHNQLAQFLGIVTISANCNNSFSKKMTHVRCVHNP